MRPSATLRWRLTLLLGIGVSFLWLLLATILLWGVRSQVQQTLDSRLAASAQMVASLMTHQQLLQASQAPFFSEQPATNSAVALPRFPASLACRVTAVSGAVLAQSYNAPDSALEAAPIGYSFQEVEGERWRVYRHHQHDLDITTAERIATRETLMGAIVLAAALPFALALAGTLAIVWLGIKRSLAPLNQLGTHVAKRDARLLEPLVWERAPAEIRPLLDEINRLLERVARAMQRERRFSGDAAHELRTPLTAIDTHLQVARLTEGERAEHALDQAARAAKRMQSTIEQLLLLTRLDSNTAFDESAVADGRAIVEAACQDLATRAGAGRIQFCSRSERTLVAAPAALITVAVRNLLDNALHFSPPQGAIDLTLKRDGDSVIFLIRDYGPGVPQEELDRLTQRFVTLKPSGGSGLGLAIADTIATRFGGKLLLRNAEPGLEAELRIPGADHTQAS